MNLADELRQAVFSAAYASPTQRRRRATALVLLGCKHGLRGVLFSWPLYMLAIASLALPAGTVWLFVPVVLAAVAVSAWILRKGIREDYGARVHGVVLGDDYWRSLLVRGESQ